MAIASISRDDAKAILTFCQENHLNEFFFSNDSGAYFGANIGSQEAGTFNKCIKYVKGMNPDVDEDYYDEVGRKFGYDDFGIHIPVQWLEVFFNSPNFAKKRVFGVKINQKSFSLVQ
jgi:hypothetical protein